ncbi:hypothetical protein KIN20_016140, partial [Parelaphostrongylus tenuis]
QNKKLRCEYVLLCWCYLLFFWLSKANRLVIENDIRTVIVITKAHGEREVDEDSRATGYKNDNERHKETRDRERGMEKKDRQKEEESSEEKDENKEKKRNETSEIKIPKRFRRTLELTKAKELNEGQHQPLEVKPAPRKNK